MISYRTHKKQFAAVLIVLILVFGGLCGYMIYENSVAGKTDGAVITIGSSQKFSRQELLNARDCVISKFKTFRGCSLTKLWYDEKQSNKQIAGYMTGGRGSQNGVKAQNVIVWYSNFKTGSKAAEQGFNENSAYTYWNWILIRDNKTGNWRADDWGY